jgi:hypothetical protein
MRTVQGVFLTLLACLALAGPASAHHPSGAHWRIADTLRLDVKACAGTEWNASLERAERAWNPSPEVEVVIRPCRSTVVAEVRARRYNFDADTIRENDGAYGFCDCQRPDAAGHIIDRPRGILLTSAPLDRYDRDWTARHEIGHALGLNHNRSESSVMYPYSGAMRPDAHDFSALLNIYRHGH